MRESPDSLSGHEPPPSAAARRTQPGYTGEGDVGGLSGDLPTRQHRPQRRCDAPSPGAAAERAEGSPEDTVTIVSNAPDKVGKYRITGVIGEGVSGVVYKAFAAAVPRVVAVKSLHGTLAADARAA